MAREITHLEPAERDPVQLRRTGWLIAAIMLLGGTLVMAAYLIKLRADSQDDRPHIVGSIIKDTFGGRDQHSKAFATSMLDGKISLVTPISGEQAERTAESLRVMKLVAEKFPEDDEFRFVGITLTPEADEPERLRAMLEELGVGDDPRWFFVQAEEENARTYLRNKLRLDLTETVPIDGEPTERFRSEIVLLDQNLHVLEPRFCFGVTREWQEFAEKAMEENPAEAKEKGLDVHLDGVREAEARLLRCLEHIRAGNLREGKKR